MTRPKPIRIAVLDYGAANMVSITKALVAVGAEPVVAAEPARFGDRLKLFQGAR